VVAIGGPPSCHHSPGASTTGIGQPCSGPGDCGRGQTCHVYSHSECPGTKCQECQILCTEHAQCPTGYACSLPPLLPDTAAYICTRMKKK